MKVYVIHSNHARQFGHEDILGVYSSFEKAHEIMVKMFGEDGTGGVSVHDIDGNTRVYRDGMLLYCVSIRLDDGIFAARTEIYPAGPQDGQWAPYTDDGVRYWCYARDEAHAIEQAREKMEELKKSGMYYLPRDVTP